MIFNYIKVTLRNILKHKGYAFINIAGLAIGMVCCLLIADVLAWPLAYFAMTSWLQNYAYRTDLGVVIFLLALVLALLVALISVSFQALRAAISQPAYALKYE